MSSENSLASWSVILIHLVIDVVIVLADGRLCNLAEASNPMCFWQAIPPFRSDQNVSVTAVSMMSLLGLSAGGSCR
jgi:hypothetical protein